MHKRERNGARDVIKQWIIKKKKRQNSSAVEETKNQTTVSAITDCGGRRSDDCGTRDTEDKTSGIEELDVGEYEGGPDGRTSPFGFLRGYIPDRQQSIPSNDTYTDYIYSMSDRSSRDSDAPQEVDEFGNTKDMGGDDDNEQLDNDTTLPTGEEEYEEWVEAVGRTMASKFVSGIYR